MTRITDRTRSSPLSMSTSTMSAMPMPSYRGIDAGITGFPPSAPASN
jgi:hypothetical protein